MRKLVATLLACGLIAGAGAAPATAGKKAKHVSETITAQLLPFPKDSNWEAAGFMEPGCTAGEQDVHWKAVEFTSPGKGELRFWMEGFTGDWDIYLFVEDGLFVRGDQAQVGAAMAPPEEEIVYPMTKGQTVSLVMCNWAGAPDAEAHYEGHFK